MTGQFFFTLLNPAVAAILTATFLVLWRKRPDQGYLAVLALAFLCCGLAFVVNDFLPHFDSPLSRITANLLFFAAITAACIGALLRVGALTPVMLYIITWVVCAAVFCWYLLIEPSTEARIYVVSMAYMVLTMTTVWTLFRTRPLHSMDWIFIALIAVLSVLSVLRPLATFLKQIDTNAGGSFRDSTYWATVQAATPVIAIAVGLAFLAALAVKLFDELTMEANRDFLTGLLNRRGFDKGVQRLLGSRWIGEQKTALMIVDIDNFKLINDSFGHAVGDDVIFMVASTLTRHGEADLVARTGGEEFTLFYRAGTRTDLMVRAEAIRLALAEIDFQQMPSDRRVTVSMGLHCSEQSESITAMMAEADRALYAAKSAGKDRAILAPSPTPVAPVTATHDRRLGSRARAS